MRLLFSLLLLAALCAGICAAQSAQSIQGLVEDASGAVVAGAKVTMTNTGTGISRTAETNSAGLYSFQLVQVGNYSVTVEIQGFKTESVANIRVETSAQVRQDFKLEVGALTEKIEISANAVQLNTENATVGGSSKISASSTCRSMAGTWWAWPCSFQAFSLANARDAVMVSPDFPSPVPDSPCRPTGSGKPFK